MELEEEEKNQKNKDINKTMDDKELIIKVIQNIMMTITLSI